MTIIDITRYISIGIPIVTFVALAVAVFLFVKYKGTMDALKDAVETFKNLAEARLAQIDQMEYQLNVCQAEVSKLKKDLDAQKESVKIAVDEIISGFERAGVCIKAPHCKDFTGQVR